MRFVVVDAQAWVSNLKTRPVRVVKPNRAHTLGRLVWLDGPLSASCFHGRVVRMRIVVLEHISEVLFCVLVGAGLRVVH